jgi:RNase adaptor protein for sRNA GlmZ degradation
MKEQDSTKMEFLLTLNDNIVVQRYFNVRGYNPIAKNSVEFYELINGIKDELQYHLKMKTVIYMMDNSESIMHDPSVMDTSYTDGPEIFNIYVKNGDTTICHRIFDGKYFPPKVRYTVDVRPFLKDILRELTDIFSEQRLSYQYLDFDLSK